MMWLMLWACSGGTDTADSGDVEEVCQSVAVASYEVVPSMIHPTSEIPAALLDSSESTLCEGDQVVWWAHYDDWFIPDELPNAESPEGAFLLDLGIHFYADVVLVLVPEGEDPETWTPCDLPITRPSCANESSSVAWLYVEALEYPE